MIHTISKYKTNIIVTKMGDQHNLERLSSCCQINDGIYKYKYYERVKKNIRPFHAAKTSSPITVQEKKIQRQEKVLDKET